MAPEIPSRLPRLRLFRSQFASGGCVFRVQHLFRDGPGPRRDPLRPPPLLVLPLKVAPPALRHRDVIPIYGRGRTILSGEEGVPPRPHRKRRRVPAGSRGRRRSSGDAVTANSERSRMCVRIRYGWFSFYPL
ncbi:hypothetical protein QJS04_geneDACA020880 [Acorus gramineus]|uniref:Uncharacterized protein n=1 Tax=Acorus gramineus TaxID=55184 RepID=A0AAV9BKW7_ACOGR|nr:hypothetical protein QJS04_geneDACA020880 [Acorus gramineus]